MENFDDIIIGSGQAGNPLASTLAEKGRRVALIEKGELGGTCVNEGCTPTKAYVASARRAFVAGNSSEMGVNTENVSIDLQKVKKRKDEIISKSRQGLQSMIEENDQIILKRGTARFEENKIINVDGQRLKGERIFVNCGARPRIPEEFARAPYLTSKTILELEEIPEHLMIVGGGPVGIEFGQIFKRFGSKVSIFEVSDRLLSAEDEDIAQSIFNILEGEGIRFHLNSKCMEAQKVNGGIEISYSCKGQESKIEGTHILIASGRIPNTDLLELKNTDIETDERGYISINDYCETSVKGIYALGDCNGEGAFTHTAYNDYQVVADRLYGEKKRKVSDRFQCYAIYMDPAFARVGLNEKDIRNMGIEASVAKMPMEHIARAREKGETKGMLKIFMEKESQKYLGASFLGAGADEYIHSIIDQMYAGSSYKVIRDAVHIHPTVSELIPTMLQDPEDLD